MSSGPWTARTRLAAARTGGGGGLSARGESCRERGGRTFEVDVVLVRDAKDVVALVSLYGLDEVPLRVLEVNLDATRTNKLRREWRGAKESLTQFQVLVE